MRTKTMTAFLAALREAEACRPALRRAAQFSSPQSFWKSLAADGGKEKPARYLLYRDLRSEWMCRLLRIAEGESLSHIAPTCSRCAWPTAKTLARYPRIGMVRGKIKAYPAKQNRMLLLLRSILLR